jgi:Xaa-Pro aminopeptidase
MPGRSALPHGVASEKMIEQGDLITLDFGCVYQGYVSDIPLPQVNA